MGMCWRQFFDYDFIEHFSVLHSHHKLHYFKMVGWEDTWIETMHSIVCEEFDRTYAFMDVECEVKEVCQLLDIPLTY